MAHTGKASRYLRYLATVILLVFLFSWILTILFENKLSGLTEPLFHNLNNLWVFFVIKVLELFPFLILGTVISGIIEVYLPEKEIQKIIPQNGLLQIISGFCLGLLIPGGTITCVPVSARLNKKGLSSSVVIPYLFSAPIINLVVLAKLFIIYGNSIYFWGSLLCPLIIIFLIGAVLFIKEDNEGSIFNNLLIESDYKKIVPSSEDNDSKSINKVIQICIDETLFFGEFLIAGSFGAAVIFFITQNFSGIWFSISGSNGLSTIISELLSHNIFIQMQYLDNIFNESSAFMRTILLFVGTIINIPNMVLFSVIIKKKQLLYIWSFLGVILLVLVISGN